jgi:hypothetical protein
MEMTWAWLGGFFEGEGNIQWYDSKPKTRQGRGSRIQIGQKDIRPLALIHEFLKKEGFVNPILYLRKANPAKKRLNPIWMLGMNRREDNTRFLEAIRPFLIQKREQADRVLELLADIRANTAAVDVPEAIRLRETGLTWAAVAGQMGFGTRKVICAVRAVGRDTNRENRFRVDWDRVRVLKAQGLTRAQIAAATGYKKETLKDFNRLANRGKKRTGPPAGSFTSNA